MNQLNHLPYQRNRFCDQRCHVCAFPDASCSFMSFILLSALQLELYYPNRALHNLVFKLWIPKCNSVYIIIQTSLFSNMWRFRSETSSVIPVNVSNLTFGQVLVDQLPLGITDELYIFYFNFSFNSSAAGLENDISQIEF